MTHIPAKCTSCGANIRINDDETRNVCEYCGQTFIVARTTVPEERVEFADRKCKKCKSEHVVVEEIQIRKKAPRGLMALGLLLCVFSFGMGLIVLFLIIKNSGEKEIKKNCQKCGYTETHKKAMY